ncbi:MAG: alpha/beta hydrolase [Alcanivoracaceae bacterium]|nr:alpha/beta hydrolase [Alcanivoracaceae bacterium]
MHSLSRTVAGCAIHYFQQEGDGDPLLFFHATGFHAGVWRKIAAEFPDRPLYLVDMPGHGESGTPDMPFRWDHAGDLMAAFIAELGLKRVTGIGHSMGGHVMLLAAASQPERFSQLILLDPVVLPLKVIPFMNAFDTSALARRRNDWASSDAFYDAYKDRAPFDSWDRDVLKDYADGALVKAEAGKGYALACDPALEASVYQNHGAAHLHSCFQDIACPVHIIRAKSLGPGDKPTDFRLSPTAPTLVNKLSLATDEQREDFTHFFPMEYPGWVAEKIRSHLR